MNDFKKFTLSNGIKVYLYSDKNCKKVYASYNIKYGSHGYYDKFYYKNEAYSLPPALAHFLEHYLIENSFKGNMLTRFKNKNYETNGVTYPEITTFYFIGIKDTAESISELIEMVDNPNFKEDKIEETKMAINEELKKNLDNKYRIAFANNRNNFSNSYSTVQTDNSVLGTVATTNSITLDDVLAAYGAYYNDENKFLVIGGNIDIDETLELLENTYKNIKPHPNEMKEFDYPDDLSLRKEREVIELRGDSDFIIVTYKEKNDFDISPIKIDSYIHIYYQLKKNYLQDKFDELNKAKVILDGMGFQLDFFKDTLALTFYTDSVDTDAFEKFLDESFDLEGLDEDEFNLIIKNMIVSQIQRRDYIYSSFENFPTQIDFSEKLDITDMLKSLTMEELKKTISKLKMNLKTVTIITNKKAN